MPTTTGFATDFITFSRAANATVTDSDGKVKWAPHNLVLNSATPATQSLTVIVGAQYTVAITGAGSVALSGAGTGTATAGSPATVTATTTTLTLTVTAPVTTMWAYRSDLGGMQLNASGSTYNATTAAAYYGPRRDFDPVTLACKGLLVEEQRTNLLVQSGFTNGLTDAGTRGGLLTATTFYNYLSNTSIAFGRDGVTSSYAYISITPAATTAYVFSTYVRMDDGNAPSFGSASATAATNDFVIVVGGAIATMTSATITHVGNSIYRVSAAVTTGGSPIAGVGVLKYDTNSTRTFRVTGYQLEAGSFATSYIPTGAATATRSADVASVATAAFPYSATEGTLVVSASTLSSGVAASLSDGTENNRAFVFLDSAYQGLVTSGGSAQAVLDGGTVSANTITKVALATKLDDFALSLNGAAVATDTSGIMPASATNLFVGSRQAGTAQLNGHIRQITYIPRRLSNTELQQRTTA